MTEADHKVNEEYPRQLADYELRRNRQLGQIFNPHAVRQTEDLYKRQGRSAAFDKKDPLRLAHYTNADAALSVIKCGHLWMRNVSCMSDFREFKHGLEILWTFFNSDVGERFVSALDLCAQGVATEAWNSFKQWLPHIHADTFISCLTEHDDRENDYGRLSMWRAYGGASGRVAIVLEIPWYTGAADAMGIIFSPVAYLSATEVGALFDEIIQSISNEKDFLAGVERQVLLNHVFYMLLAAACCLKHPGFKEEKEWRAIYIPKFRDKYPRLETTVVTIEGIPQHIHKIPLNSKHQRLAGLRLDNIFDRLIIGPTQYPEVMRKAFAEALTEVGIRDAESKIVCSDIPIRT